MLWPHVTEITIYIFIIYIYLFGYLIGMNKDNSDYSHARDSDGEVRFLLYSTTICHRCHRDMKVTVVQSRVPSKVGHGCNLQFGRTAVHV